MLFSGRRAAILCAGGCHVVCCFRGAALQYCAPEGATVVCRFLARCLGLSTSGGSPSHSLRQPLRSPPVPYPLAVLAQMWAALNSCLRVLVQMWRHPEPMLASAGVRCGARHAPKSVGPPERKHSPAAMEPLSGCGALAARGRPCTARPCPLCRAGGGRGLADRPAALAARRARKGRWIVSRQTRSAAGLAQASAPTLRESLHSSRARRASAGPYLVIGQADALARRARESPAPIEAPAAVGLPAATAEATQPGLFPTQQGHSRPPGPHTGRFAIKRAFPLRRHPATTKTNRHQATTGLREYVI
jgi:hypothetical protein